MNLHVKSGKNSLQLMLILFSLFSLDIANPTNEDSLSVFDGKADLAHG